MEVAHWFILNNSDETIIYLAEHEQMIKRDYPSHLYAKKDRELFSRICKFFVFVFNMLY